MTEKELQLLGFTKEVEHGTECSNESGKKWIEDAYHYYVYTVTKGLEFISNASDEVGNDGQWSVEFFETEIPVIFYNFEEVQALINLLEKAKIQK